MKYFLARVVLAATLLGMPPLGCGTLPVVSQPDEIDSLRRDAKDSTSEALPTPHRLDEQPAESPPLEVFNEAEEDSAEGLSLDTAIDRLLAVNLDLAAQFQDIPKARADVLTAGLRSDPVVFMSAVPIPYGQFSAQRPGATTYDITIVQPLDLSGKHRTNKRAAEMSIPVLEAHYQDAVRLEIDRLFTVFANLLEARAEARAARDNLKILTEAAQRCGEQVRQGRRPQTDLTRLSIRQAKARIAVRQAEASLLHGQRNLSVLLAIPAGEADRLHICGSLRDRAPPPLSTPELIEMARQARPDLRALQLSVDRAHAEVRREKAESVDDFFLFFTPYQVVDLTPQGNQIASSWEIGVMVPIPSLNRNQGEIQRARVNVAQWRMEVERIEHEIIDEVRRAAAEYSLSRQVVEQYERDILAPVRRRREETHRRFLEEDNDGAPFLSAQRDYDETIRAYLEALARHRRSMLRLNTAVGQRIMP